MTFWKSTLQTDHKNSRLGVVWRRKGNVRKASAALYSQNDHFCIAPFRMFAVRGTRWAIKRIHMDLATSLR